MAGLRGPIPPQFGVVGCTEFTVAGARILGAAVNFVGEYAPDSTPALVDDAYLAPESIPAPLDLNGVLTVLAAADMTMDLLGEFQPIQSPGDFTETSFLIDNICIVNPGGGGGGSIDVYDEGGLVTSGITKLNFIGPDVLAQDAGGGCVDVFIPPPTFVSHFNTTDGTNNANVPPVNGVQRFVSAPSGPGAPFFVDGWDDGFTHPVTRTSPLSWSTLGAFSIFDLTTTITVNIRDADSPANIVQTFTTPAITANAVLTSGPFTITIGSFGPDTTKFQATFQLDIDINSVFPAGGRFTVEVIHNNSTDGTFTFNQADSDNNDLFYDAQTQTATSGSVLITENTPVTKFLSGVEYFDLGSTWNIFADSINDLNYESYPLTQYVMTAPNFGILTQNFTGPSLDFWTNAFDNAGAEVPNPTIFTTTVTPLRFAGNAVLSGIAQDWTPSAPATDSNSIIIDTFPSVSTAIGVTVIEGFEDEDQRRASVAVAWDPVPDLPTDQLQVEGGRLQVQGNGLLVPGGDYTPYSPNPGGQPDYSGGGAALQSYGRFYGDTASRSGGLIDFGATAIVEADFGTNVTVLISLDGVNYYNCTLPYLGGILNNGDGCRVNSGVTMMPQFEFTLGTFNTSLASNGVPTNSMVVLVQMPNTSPIRLEQMNLTWNI